MCLPTPPLVPEQLVLLAVVILDCVVEADIDILNFAVVPTATVEAVTAVLEVVAVNTCLKFRMLTR
jgi:hypothetical protein